ncbi:MAG TPA: carbon-nitrogen hydrolase family protein [Verrucomicrobiae bacterium]|nr:carbon-nitrogen hydrolase family protein [Verrucomicrobiae bacterium]
MAARSPHPARSQPVQLRLAAVQMRFASDLAGNLACIEKALRTAARRRADVVLFPECAITGYHFNFGTLRPSDLQIALAQVAAWAAQHCLNVLIGSPLFHGRHLRNCLVVFDRMGRVTYVYAKCQLTEMDRRIFTPGDAIALFEVDGIPATAIICHERRYPELVRLAVMAGARLLFHPNAGLDSLAVSKRKWGGRDGIAVRAFENAIPYVFANSVGPQGDGKWSAGDSKIVGADGRCLRLADNRRETVIVADVDLRQATGKYALESLGSPRFLGPSWRRMVALVQRRARREATLARRTLQEMDPIRA